MRDGITYLGRVNHRSDDCHFGIKQEDRFLHLYVLGKTGTGKSTLLGNMATQDFSAGRGFALIDPHGDTEVAKVQAAATQDAARHADPATTALYIKLAAGEVRSAVAEAMERRPKRTKLTAVG
jgi:DNA helicase HerA-like ATPase